MCELDHCLDNASELQTAGRDTRDPPKTAKPSNDIRERLLQWSWSEFANEVILAYERVSLRTKYHRRECLPPAVGAIEASSPLPAVSNVRIVLKVCRYPHRCDHAHHEHPDRDRAIDNTCSATVEQTKIAGQQSVLPSRLKYRHEANNADEFKIALPSS